MEHPAQGLERIGAAVRETLAAQPGASEEIRRGRIAFLEEVERRNGPPGFLRSPRQGRRGLPLILATSFAVSAAGLWLWMRPLTFQVGQNRPGRLGDVVEGVVGVVTPLHFSDGSAVLLHEGGRMRVLSLEAGAARVLVEDGVIDAAIAHRKLGKTRWDFEAAPIV